MNTATDQSLSASQPKIGAAVRRADVDLVSNTSKLSKAKGP